MISRTVKCQRQLTVVKGLREIAGKAAYRVGHLDRTTEVMFLRAIACLLSAHMLYADIRRDSLERGRQTTVG